MVEGVGNEKVSDEQQTFIMLKGWIHLNHKMLVCISMPIEKEENTGYRMFVIWVSSLYFPHEFYILWTCFQIANHLDRAVVSLGREPLKVMVQVNTSGEECEYKEDIKLI
jgi:hypothetical protein